MLGAAVREHQVRVAQQHRRVEVAAEGKDVVEARPGRHDHELGSGAGLADRRLERQEPRDLQRVRDRLLAHEAREPGLFARDDACPKQPKDHLCPALDALDPTIPTVGVEL